MNKVKNYRAAAVHCAEGAKMKARDLRARRRSCFTSWKSWRWSCPRCVSPKLSKMPDVGKSVTRVAPVINQMQKENLRKFYQGKKYKPLEDTCHAPWAEQAWGKAKDQEAAAEREAVPAPEVPGQSLSTNKLGKKKKKKKLWRSYIYMLACMCIYRLHNLTRLFRLVLVFSS